MSSPRKHPSLYPPRLTDLLSGPSITLSLPTHRATVNLRYQLYAFRESLRRSPNYNPALLRNANLTIFKIHNTTLHIIKEPSLTKPRTSP